MELPDTLAHLPTALRSLLHRRPLLTASLATLSLTPLALHIYHLSLRRRLTKHIALVPPPSRQAAVEVRELESLPADLVDHPKKYRIVHDKAVVVVPGPAVGILLARAEPDRLRNLFTRVLRRQFADFAASPQGWMLYMPSPPAVRPTFSAAYLEGLEFETDDTAAGIWTVVRRGPMKVECAMRVPAEMEGKFGGVEGRLVLSLRMRGDGAVLAMECVQWVPGGEGGATKLPLEGWAARWLHEVVAWRGLLRAGRAVREMAEEEVKVGKA